MKWFANSGKKTGSGDQTRPAAAIAPLAMALEPRMLFDGAIAATIVETQDSTLEPASAQETASITDTEGAAIAGSADNRQEIVFVDTQVQDYQQLLAGLPTDVEVVMFDGSSDGLQVIADTLAGRSAIDAIHILSHGDNGQVQLGNDWFDSNDIAARGDLLATIGQSMSEDGDILLYGCTVGGNGAGVEFIDALASATGADIAASNDLTGAADKGGDWELEATQGSIEAVSLDLSNYSRLLTAFSDSLDTNVGTGVTSFTSNLGGVDFIYTFTTQGDSGDITSDTAFGQGDSASVRLLSGNFDFGSIERVTIARTDAADFTFSSLYINNSGGGVVTVGGYLDGALVGSAQTITTGATGTLSFGAIGVDEVRITSADFFQTNIDSFAGDTNPPAPPTPTLTSATYNAATGVLTATGTNMTTGDNIDVSTLTLTGEGGSNYTLTDSSNVTASSSTTFSVTLSATDKAALNLITNKNGTSSTGGTTFNLAAADDWNANATAGDTADATNTLTVSNVVAPTITSATYDASGGTLIVTGSDLLSLSGAANDIVANKFTLTGEGGSTYTLTDTANVEVSSGTAFTLALSATDKAALNQIINKSGTSSTSATTYNLAAAEDWAAGADAAVAVADVTSNGITVSNVALPTISSATFDASTGVLTVTGTGLLSYSGASNDIDTSKLTFTGEGGSTYTLTDTASVEITSGSSFTLTLSATDKSELLALLNKDGTSASDATTYNLAAADDWAAGADAALNVADLTSNGITVTNANAAPALGNLNGDSIAWAGVGNTLILDVGGNAALSDAELDALNGGNGDWAGASLGVQRAGIAVSSDILGFDTAGAIFTVSGSNLQSGGLTFATFTNTGGVLSINFTSSGTAATTALMNDVAQHVTYRNDTPAGDATLRFTLNDGTSSATADVTVTTDTIYVTNTSDTATVNLANGVSFSEAVAIAAADVTGSQTLVFSNSFSSTMTLAGNLAINESLTLNADAADGLRLSGSTITLGGGTTLNVTNSTGSVTISSTLAGSGGLSKAGAGELELTSSSNSGMAGDMAVTAGTLFITSDSHLSSGTLVLDGGELYMLVTGGSSGSPVTSTIDNVITLGASGGTISVGGGGGRNIADFSGIISGSGSLTKSANSILQLSGNNSFTGETNLQAGTLIANHNNALGSTAGATTVAGGTNLRIAGGLTLPEAITLSGTGKNVDGVDYGALHLVTGSSTVLGDLSLATDANVSAASGSSLVLSGALNGSFELNKTDAGTLTLSNATNSGSMSGGIKVSAGTLSVAGDSYLPSGTLSLNGGTLALTAATTIDNSISLLADSTLSHAADVTLSGTISGSATTLSKSGAGTLTLSNTSNSVSNWSLSATAGSVSISAASHLASGDLTLNASNLLLSGSNTYSNNINLAGDATITTNDDSTLAGIISGAGNLTKSGTATLSLNGNNIYTGATTISTGALLANSDNALGTTAGGTTIASGAILAVNSGVTVSDALSVSGVGFAGLGALYSTGNTTIAGAVTLTGNTSVGVTSGGNQTFSNTISGASNLTKLDAGTVTLAGTNTYSGTTTVSAGTLSITGSTNSTTTVASGATLAGSGTLGGAVSIQSGGTLAPGVDGAGTLTLGNDLAISSGGTLSVDITGATAGAGYDVVDVTGTVDVSSATIATTHSYTPGSGDSYTIITNDAADALTGTFTGVAEGGTLTAGGNATELSASYIGGTGNDFTLTAPANPVVNSVSSSSPDGSLKIGDLVSITVVFDQVVTVNTAGGAPQLHLETGTTDQTINYVSGSGTSILTFQYTVQAGDESADLDYLSTSALTLNGATIQNGSGHNAILTLAAPGDVNSLGANKALVVDGVRPTATIVVTDTALSAGDTSAVTITFSEAVTGLTAADFSVANGALSSLGSTDGGITWTATLTPGSDVEDTTNLIVLNNTGVMDAAGNTGSGTTDSNNYAIDSLRPTASIVVADTALSAGETSAVTITFNEAVTGLTTADFTVANGALSSLGSTDGGITWTATLTPSADTEDSANLISLDNTGVMDAAGNAGSGTTDSNNYTVDSLRPTASIVVTDTALSAGETSAVTITFSEAVTGLTTADFSVANGTLSSLGSTDGGFTWTATLTPDASVEDTTNLIVLNNTGVADTAGNTGSGTTDSNNYAIDSLRPTVSIIVTDTALAAGETSAVTITFSEAVTGLTTADFTVANGALSALSTADGGITWTATLTPDARVEDTTNLIVLNNTGVADTAGNAGSGTTDSNNYAIDSLRPTASIVVADTALAAGESSAVTITFSEAVTGLTTADFSVANGAISALSTADGGITWTATLTPDASVEDTTNLISLDNTGVADTAGNAGSGTTDSNNYAIDSLRPTATIVVTDTALSAGDTSAVTITFSEAVTGLSAADFSVANGALSSLGSTDGGITWTATLTPSADTEDTTNLISLDNTGVADTAGNAGSGTTDSNNYAIDSLRPTASIIVTDTALAAGESSAVTITFSEAVTGLTTADFSVANGAISALSTADGGITWIATLTPSADTEATTNLISLDNTGVADTAGNTGSGTTDSNNYAIDSLRPTASIIVTDTALAAGESSAVTITFSEAVTGLNAGDFNVANGALSSLGSTDGGITWTATLTPSADTEDTTNLISLDNTGVADTAGNAGSGTTDSNNYAIDSLRPTVSIIVTDTALAAGETSAVTITFSEAVTGLTTADFTVANGALSALSTADGGITWTATLTPDASVEDTTNLISLDNTGVADTAGNAGSGTTDSNNYAIDSLRPTATIVVTDTALAAGETSAVTITFSEAVTGLTTADFSVANGALSSLGSTDGGITWTATLTPGSDVEDTTNLIVLNNTGVMDAAGNAGSGTTDSNNYAIDSLRPTASIVVADTALSAGETSAVTITFNEAVTGLTTADFTVANGALSSLGSTDGGITWTATLTPSADTEDSANLISLDNTGVMDAAGNAGSGTTDSNNYTVDSLRPTASIVVTDTALSAGETSAVTITFSEAVTGLTTADFTVANGTLSSLGSTDGGFTWTATLTPDASVEDTTNLIMLNNTGVMDSAGNTGSGTTDSNNYAIDSLRPTASIVVTDTALAAGETSAVTITFSEAVTGLNAGDFNVANGALSSLGSTDGGITWTATLTPDASVEDTTNLIVLNNTGVADTAGNAGSGTTDSNNYAIDSLTPTVNSVSVPANGTYVAGQSLDFTVNLNEAVLVDTTGGTPRLAVTLDVGGTVYADYVSGSGSTALLFSLTVLGGQLDTDGIELGTNIDLNGATLRDGAGNNATSALNSIESNAAVLIDAAAPSATSISVPADGALVAGEMYFELVFDEAVSGVDIGDFSLLTTGNLVGTLDSVQQINPSTYRVLLTGINGNGSLSLALNATGSGIADNAGNALATGITSPGYGVVAQTGDPEFRTSTLGARPASSVSSLPTAVAASISPSPFESPLQPQQLFVAPTLGSGIPTLSALFINNGAPAPSYLAQVFAGHSGDGSGRGFLGFGGGDAGVFGHSTLSNIFDPDSELEPGSIQTGLREAFGTPGFGAPTLGQRLQQMQNTEQRQIEQLARALSEINPGEPHA
uniref:Ig-like domain-containing protein n=1 Tax=Marinobacterium profundum TaxID=1714300 RepID=UPI0008339920|nr:Ig-like domain-containing protein [Marinobacterium profundum]